ncbi:MAG TPA: DUF3488 and transglutaminase-like domain-containing protein [Solimonas sp.]|nr:DUF3488 and transglutaminase-like domain-containing protein [Solimonas sp.]
MAAQTAADHLNQTSLLRFIAVLALVLAAHATLLPGWELAVIVAVLAWRAAAARHQWPLPHWSLRTAITLAVFAGVYFSFGQRINGQEPGTALICLMAALKLLEMRSRRDVMVTVFLMYFILLTHFLFSQEIWTILYLFACALAITALLVDVNHAGEPLPLRAAFGVGSRMVAYAVPLMLIFFVLFPRIPGPLWGLPSDAGGSTSGISDEMSPGDISKLVNSEEVAFRVQFFGAVPRARELYWRGPVMSHFDGRAWSQGPSGYADLKVQAALIGKPYSYEITLEPHPGRWLFALDLPDPRSTGLPRGSSVSATFQLLSLGIVRQRTVYQLQSYPQYHAEVELNPYTRRENLRLPRNYNPRAVALAKGWRAQGLDDLGIVNAVLNRFRSENYVYTREPPKLGRNSVDEFLFDTREGFCEHYAAAFSFLMRAADIPARVVAGYQGAELNDVGDYYVVRQSNAHAWTEVWLPEQGWVRVDPTSAVAPDRVESSQGAIAERQGAFSLARMQYWAEARWDWANQQWNRWVLGFGPELQQDLMRALGIVDWGQMVLLLTVLVVGVLGMVSLTLLRQFAPARNHDQALRLWRKSARWLNRHGVVQRPHEGPSDFVARLEREQPELAPTMRRVLRAYLQLRYLEEPAPALHEELAAAVGELKITGAMS